MGNLTDILILLAGLCTSLVVMYAAFTGMLNGKWVSALVMGISAILGFLIIYFAENLAEIFVGILGSTSPTFMYAIAIVIYILGVIQFFSRSARSSFR